MNGRFPSGVYVELYGGLPSGDEEALADRLRTLATHPGFDHALQYDPLGGGGTHVLMLETERWDMEDVPRELDADAPMDARLAAAVLLRGVFRRCGPSVRPTRSGFLAAGWQPDAVTATLVTTSRYRAAVDTSHYVTSEDATEFAFNTWYNTKWLPGELSWGTVTAGYRFASTETDATGRRSYLAVYETDDAAPERALERHRELRATNPPAEPFPGAEFGPDHALRPRSLVATR